MTKVPIPDGLEDTSLIEWQAVIEVDNAKEQNGGSFGPRYIPKAGKWREIVRPHPGGGSVSLIVYVKYSLLRAHKGSKWLLYSPPFPLEKDAFSFGCSWKFAFEAGKLEFGPPEEFVLPGERSSKMVQGSCRKFLSKDQTGTAILPYVFCSPQLNLRAAADNNPLSGITFGLPDFPWATYSPSDGKPTPDGGWSLGDFWIEFQVEGVEVREPKINLNPNLLQILITYEAEGQSVMSADKQLALKRWIESVKNSELYPVIQNGSLKLYMRGHASPTDTDSKDEDVATKRREKAQKFIEDHMGAPPDFVRKEDKGHDGTPPGLTIPAKLADRNKILEQYRNVGIFFKDSEAQTALVRYYKETKTQ